MYRHAVPPRGETDTSKMTATWMACSKISVDVKPCEHREGDKLFFLKEKLKS